MIMGPAIVKTISNIFNTLDVDKNIELAEDEDEQPTVARDEFFDKLRQVFGKIDTLTRRNGDISGNSADIDDGSENYDDIENNPEVRSHDKHKRKHTETQESNEKQKKSKREKEKKRSKGKKHSSKVKRKEQKKKRDEEKIKEEEKRKERERRKKEKKEEEETMKIEKKKEEETMKKDKALRDDNERELIKKKLKNKCKHEIDLKVKQCLEACNKTHEQVCSRLACSKQSLKDLRKECEKSCGNTFVPDSC